METLYTIPVSEFGYRVAIADLIKFERYGYYTISRINVPVGYRGKGYGSQLLQRITKDADLGDYILILDVLATGALDHQQLIDWYIRYGFQLSKNVGKPFIDLAEMVRIPKTL